MHYENDSQMKRLIADFLNAFLRWLLGQSLYVGVACQYLFSGSIFQSYSNGLVNGNPEN